MTWKERANLAADSVLGSLSVALRLGRLVLGVSACLLLLARDGGVGSAEDVSDGLLDSADGRVVRSVDLQRGSVLARATGKRTNFGWLRHGWRREERSVILR